MTLYEKLEPYILGLGYSPKELDAILRDLKEVEAVEVDYSDLTPWEALEEGFIWNQTKNPEQWATLYERLVELL